MMTTDADGREEIGYDIVTHLDKNKRNNKRMAVKRLKINVT